MPWHRLSQGNVALLPVTRINFAYIPDGGWAEMLPYYLLSQFVYIVRVRYTKFRQATGNKATFSFFPREENNFSPRVRRFSLAKTAMTRVHLDAPPLFYTKKMSIFVFRKCVIEICYLNSWKRLIPQIRKLMRSVSENTTIMATLTGVRLWSR